jgi:hypothetical protein
MGGGYHEGLKFLGDNGAKLIREVRKGECLSIRTCFIIFPGLDLMKAFFS